MKMFMNDKNFEQNNKKEATQIFSGQSEASAKTLEIELKKAGEKGNKPLVCSILNTLLKRSSSLINKEKILILLISFRSRRTNHSKVLFPTNRRAFGVEIL